MSQDKELTNKQKAFIAEYLIDFNATQAAIRAGYSKDTANQIGPENLVKLGDIIKAECRAILKDKSDIALKSYKELKKIAFADISGHFEFDETGEFERIKIHKDSDTSLIKSIEITDRVLSSRNRDNEETMEEVIQRKTKFSYHDKLKALELLTKITELITDRSQVQLIGENGEPIEFNINIKECPKQ